MKKYTHYSFHPPRRLDVIADGFLIAQRWFVMCFSAAVHDGFLVGKLLIPSLSGHSGPDKNSHVLLEATRFSALEQENHKGDHYPTRYQHSHHLFVHCCQQ
uniref:Uncharacterized protein n=1 Tax=Lotharella globosa TaxID=91324 RepID=A0A7S4DRD5_9EUKA